MIESLITLAHGVACCGASTSDYVRPLVIGVAITAGIMLGAWLAVRGGRRG